MIEQWFKKTWTSSGAYTNFDLNYSVVHTENPLITANVMWNTSDSGNIWIWINSQTKTSCNMRSAPNPSATDFINIIGY